MVNIFFRSPAHRQGCCYFDREMICDGLGITLAEFFDTPEFNALEQEIK